MEQGPRGKDPKVTLLFVIIAAKELIFLQVLEQ